MKKTINKKGRSEFGLIISTLFAIIILFMGIALVIIPAAENYFIINELKTKKLNHDILSSRLVTSPHCFASVEDTGVHVGIINKSKINETTLKNCIKKKSAKVLLKEIENGKTKTIKEIENGEPDKKNNTQTFLIKYMENGNLKNGILEVTLNA